jgi:hypothetical protein
MLNLSPDFRNVSGDSAVNHASDWWRAASLPSTHTQKRGCTCTVKVRESRLGRGTGMCSTTSTSDCQYVPHVAFGRGLSRAILQAVTNQHGKHIEKS